MIISKKKVLIQSPDDILKFFSTFLKKKHKDDLCREHLWVIGLNTKLVSVFVDLITIGTANNVFASPKDVFRTAVKYGVPGIVVIHNHPSGDVKPGRKDFKFTEQLVICGRILEIEVIDSIVIGFPNFYYSFRAKHPSLWGKKKNRKNKKNFSG
uniref:MPN domain-containing protein n=1 Tax=candidate division WOR-3 bacterium TaxID=2052148 RepID=A0A7C4Y677_UNCW3